MTTAAIFGLPEAPTVLFIVALLIVVGYLLLRAYSRNQQVEIDGLRVAVKELNTKVDRLDAKYDEQRSLKHKALNDLAKSRLALDIVRRLQAECSCGALDPLAQILNNLTEAGDI